MTQLALRWIVMLALGSIVVLAACEPARERSVVEQGDDGLRTFSWVSEVDGVPRMCTAIGVAEPVMGELAGDRSATPEPVWLRAPDGGTYSVVWPAGFSIRFEPTIVLYDERSRAVARDGETVVLGQTSLASATGTYDDPFIAAGLVFHGCYVFMP